MIEIRHKHIWVLWTFKILKKINVLFSVFSVSKIFRKSGTTILAQYVHVHVIAHGLRTVILNYMKCSNCPNMNKINLNSFVNFIHFFVKITIIITLLFDNSKWTQNIGSLPYLDFQLTKEYSNAIHNTFFRAFTTTNRIFGDRKTSLIEESPINICQKVIPATTAVFSINTLPWHTQSGNNTSHAAQAVDN